MDCRNLNDLVVIFDSKNQLDLMDGSKSAKKSDSKSSENLDEQLTKHLHTLRLRDQVRSSKGVY